MSNQLSEAVDAITNSYEAYRDLWQRAIVQLDQIKASEVETAYHATVLLDGEVLATVTVRLLNVEGFDTHAWIVADAEPPEATPQQRRTRLHHSLTGPNPQELHQEGLLYRLWKEFQARGILIDHVNYRTPSGSTWSYGGFKHRYSE
jgi:hypothetical protein